MWKKIFASMNIAGLLYLVFLMIADERMNDGALDIHETYLWEFPIVVGMVFSTMCLWLYGLRRAVKISVPTLLIAFFFWPFGVFLAFKYEE